MSNSLRDQLVKAGLATSSQAKKAEKQSRAEQASKRHRGGKKNRNAPAAEKPDSAKDSSPQAKAKRLQAEKAKKDKQLAKSRNDKYAQRALRAEIKQILKEHDQRTKVTDDEAVPYNFVHGKRIKRVYVTAAQRDQLSSGRLIVINNDGNYHFVAPDIAAKIEQRDPKRIIVAHKDADKEQNKEKTADDEFYAKFEVPDDLDW